VARFWLAWARRAHQLRSRRCWPPQHRAAAPSLAPRVWRAPPRGLAIFL